MAQSPLDPVDQILNVLGFFGGFPLVQETQPHELVSYTIYYLVQISQRVADFITCASLRIPSIVSKKHIRKPMLQLCVIASRYVRSFFNRKYISQSFPKHYDPAYPKIARLLNLLNLFHEILYIQEDEGQYYNIIYYKKKARQINYLIFQYSNISKFYFCLYYQPAFNWKPSICRTIWIFIVNILFYWFPLGLFFAICYLNNYPGLNILFPYLEDNR